MPAPLPTPAPPARVPHPILAAADALEREARAAARRDARPRWVLASTRGGVRLLPLGERLVVGRGSGCDLALASRRVSRRHAALTLWRGELAIEDLESTNGTFAGGDEVRVRELAQGEEVWFADEPVRFWLR